MFLMSCCVMVELVTAEHPALDRAERAPPVYTVVLVEAFVLDGNNGVLEIVRNFVAVDPFAVLSTLDGLINNLLTRFRIGSIDEGIEVEAETLADFGSSFFRGRVDVRVNIEREGDAAEAAAQHADEHKRQQHAPEKPSDDRFIFSF